MYFSTVICYRKNFAEKGGGEGGGRVIFYKGGWKYLKKKQGLKRRGCGVLTLKEPMNHTWHSARLEDPRLPLIFKSIIGKDWWGCCQVVQILPSGSQAVDKKYTSTFTLPNSHPYFLHYTTHLSHINHPYKIKSVVEAHSAQPPSNFESSTPI